MTSPLFRVEALASRRDTWLGDTQIVRPISATLVTTLSIAFVVAIVGYGTLGTYTRRVHATGIMAPKTGLIVVASPSAGRIVTASAGEGVKVTRGQLLFTIDVDAVSASGPTQESVLEQLRLQTKSVETQRAKRAEVAAVERSATQRQLANTKDQSEGIDKEVALQRTLTQSLRDRADQLKAASARGVALTSEFQTQNYLYIQANAQLAQFEQTGLQLVGKISELQAKLAAFDANLARELAEMDRQIAQLRQQTAETQAKHAIEVRAPEDGLLTSLRVHVGQQVPAGGTLLTLLPTVGNLQASLFVDSSAIGFVKKGERVMLRYAAFPFQRFGLYRGSVSEVTRAPVDVGDPQQGAGGAAGGAKGLYRILVKPDSDYVSVYGDKRALEAGMQVEADVALERRPLYRWLVDPVYHLERSAELVAGSEAR